MWRTLIEGSLAGIKGRIMGVLVSVNDAAEMPCGAYS